jgi:hypothetical protein
MIASALGRDPDGYAQQPEDSPEGTAGVPVSSLLAEFVAVHARHKHRAAVAEASIRDLESTPHAESSRNSATAGDRHYDYSGFFAGMALESGLSHWRAVDPSSNAWWRRVDGHTAEYTCQSGVGWPDFLRAQDCRHPVRWPSDNARPISIGGGIASDPLRSPHPPLDRTFVQSRLNAGRPSIDRCSWCSRLPECTETCPDCHPRKVRLDTLSRELAARLDFDDLLRADHLPVLHPDRAAPGERLFLVAAYNGAQARRGDPRRIS